MHLRPYQRSLLSKAEASLKEAATILQLPTGGGKTHIAAELAKRAGKRTWFISHRREIAMQTSAALTDFGVPHAFVAAGKSKWPDTPIQVCSINMLGREMDQMPPPDLVIWDECHHMAAPSWVGVRSAFPDAKHFGLSATPIRLDGVGLSGFFDRLICGPTTSDLIGQGFLSAYRMFAPTIPDLRGVGMLAGDYAKRDLSERMGDRSLVGDVVEHWKRICPGSRTIAFAASRKASQALVDRFNQAGVPAAHIDATSSPKNRAQAISDLRLGHIKLLSNVEIFTEGFDAPAIDAVMLLRPTKSLALYRQMIGRGLRTALGKDETTILDHAGLIFEHGLPDEETDWSLDGDVAVAKSAKGTGLRQCPECSSLHKWDRVCVECGYVYKPHDRSVAEINGELRELSSVKIDGHETFREFAVRLGMDQSNLRRTIYRLDGRLPRHGSGLVPIEDALAWLRSQKTSGSRLPIGWAAGEAENSQTFAKRIGMSRRGVIKLFPKGLPQAPNGWVITKAALRWVAEYRSAKSKPAGTAKKLEPKPSLKGETVRKFAERWNVTVQTVNSWVNKGLPVHNDGTIHSEPASMWAAQWKAKSGPGHYARVTPSGDNVTKTDFARRLGLSKTGGVRGLIRLGLPLEVDGSVNLKRGASWYEGLPSGAIKPRHRKVAGS